MKCLSHPSLSLRHSLQPRLRAISSRFVVIEGAEVAVEKSSCARNGDRPVVTFANVTIKLITFYTFGYARQDFPTVTLYIFSTYLYTSATQSKEARESYFRSAVLPR